MLPLTATLLAVDIVSKQYVLDLVSSVNVFPGCQFTLVFNHGVAFGFLSGIGIWFHVLCVLVFLVYFYVWSKKKDMSRLFVWTWSLMVAGAVGNTIDRIFYGHVIDFIDLYYGSYHWYVFNLADAYLTIGVLGLLWIEHVSQRKGRTTDHRLSKEN